jgi:hypothetical protein
MPHVPLEPRNLFLEKSNALSDLTGRQQRQILANLVDDLLLRSIVIVDRGHGAFSGAKILTRAAAVVTPQRIRSKGARPQSPTHSNHDGKIVLTL